MCDNQQMFYGDKMNTCKSNPGKMSTEKSFVMLIKQKDCSKLINSLKNQFKKITYVLVFQWPLYGLLKAIPKRDLK